MPQTPFDPFRHLDHWRRDVDKFFSGFGFQSEFGSPRVDVHETENEVVATCELPGLDKKEDVHIHVDDNMLTIHGSINRSTDVKDEQMHRRERSYGRFQRTLALPHKVEAQGTKAVYKNGILEVIMLKSNHESHKRIDVDFQ